MSHKKKLDGSKSRIVEQWYEKYRLFIFKVAMKKVHNEDTANDVLQETFIRLINNFDIFHLLNDYKKNTYVVKTVTSVINDWYRKTERMVYVEDIVSIIDESNILKDTTLSRAMLDEQIEIVSKCMEKLDEGDRSLIQCKYVYQMNTKEISDMLGIPREYVSLYVNRAKRRLIIAVGGEKNE